MRKFVCRVFGHNWDIPHGFDLVMPILCGRCGHDMDYRGAAMRHHPELFMNVQINSDLSGYAADIRRSAVRRVV